MADVTTTIRIDADTRQALEAMEKLQGATGALARSVLAAEANAMTPFGKAMDNLSRRSGPMLGSTFGMLSSQVVSMTTGFSGASRIMATLGQSMMMVSPVIGGVAIAAAALTAVFLKKKDAVQSVTDAYAPHLETLKLLIEANDSVSISAKRRSVELVAQKEKALRSLEVQLREIESTGVAIAGVNLHALALDDLVRAQTGYTRAQLESMGITLSMTQFEVDLAAATKKSSEERTLAADKLREAIAKIRAELKAFGDEAGKIKWPWADESPAQMTMLADIEKAKAALLSGEAMGGGPMATQAQQDALEAFRAGLNERTQIQFEASRSIAQMEQMYRDLGLTQDQAFSDAVIQIKERETKRLAALDNKQAKDFSLGKELQLKAAVQTAAQMLILQNASLKETIAAVIAEQRARLASIAIVALVEGIYYSLTNPAVAATKFAAAAEAGAGAIALSVLGSAFNKDQDRREAQSEEALAVGGNARNQSSGRTLVSQGPVTLYYSSTIVVNGSILDKGDFFSLWNDANLENLRRAGLDAGQRGK